MVVSRKRGTFLVITLETTFGRIGKVSTPTLYCTGILCLDESREDQLRKDNVVCHVSKRNFDRHVPKEVSRFLRRKDSLVDPTSYTTTGECRPLEGSTSFNPRPRSSETVHNHTLINDDIWKECSSRPKHSRTSFLLGLQMTHLIFLCINLSSFRQFVVKTDFCKTGSISQKVCGKST